MSKNIFTLKTPIFDLASQPPPILDYLGTKMQAGLIYDIARPNLTIRGSIFREERSYEIKTLFKSLKG